MANVSYVTYNQIGGEMIRLDVIGGFINDVSEYKDYEILDYWNNGDRVTYYIQKKKDDDIKDTKPLEEINIVKEYHLIQNKTEEINKDGIQTQKKNIIKFLKEDCNIPQSKNIDIFLKDNNATDNLCIEGFYIEGYKIKFNCSSILCNYEYELPYHIKNKYTSSKLIDIYNLLKDKFDVVPVIATIIDSTNATRISPFKFKEDECTRYQCIKYLEINKDDINMNEVIETMENINNPCDALINTLNLND